MAFSPVAPSVDFNSLFFHRNMDEIPRRVFEALREPQHIRACSRVCR